MKKLGFGTMRLPRLNPDDAIKRFEEFYSPLNDPSPTPASLAIRYAASLDNVMMVLSGMSDIGQLDNNTTFMKDFKPLSDEEYRLIDSITQILRSIGTIQCTSCRYCTEVCPKNINIPEYCTTCMLSQEINPTCTMSAFP